MRCFLAQLCLLCCFLSASLALSGQTLQQKLEEFANDQLAIEAFQSYLDNDVTFKASTLDTETLVATVSNQLSSALSKKFEERIEALENIRTRLEEVTSFPAQTTVPDCCTATLDENDSRFRAEVDLDNACRWGQKRQSAKKHLPDQVVEVMKKNLQRWPTLKWQYFGSEEGVMNIYPANKMCDPDYEHRYRPFYVETATPRPKDVVVVIDVSGSMSSVASGSSSTLIDIAIKATITVIDTLNPNDRVGIVAFSDRAQTPPGTSSTSTCYATQLAKATPENKAYLRQFANRLAPGGGTFYIRALDAAFDFFKQTPADTYDVRKRDKAILFMTDGKPQDGADDIRETIRTRNAQLNNEVSILTYGIGGAKEESASALLLEMALEVEADGRQGTFTSVEKDEDLRDAMGSYYEFFAVLSANEPVTFTIPYIDAFGIGLVTSACLPVINRNSGNNALLGVACVDITLSDLLSDITYFRQGELSYAFVVDGQSRLLTHPLLPRPYEVHEEPIFVYMPTLEPDTEDIRLSMVSGLSGTKDVRTRRIFSRGNLKQDGVILREFQSTYSWMPVESSNFSLCVVLAHDDRQTTIEGSPTDSNFRYHELELGNTDGLCRHFGRLARKEQSTVKFGPEAFSDPYRYLDIEETLNDIQRYENYMTGASGDTSNTFKTGIRDTVGVTAKFDELINPSDYAVWRYLATEDGIVRVIPGISLPKPYDGTLRPWYLRSVGNRGMLTVSTPYEDNFGAGMVITLARVLFEGKPSGQHDPDDAVFGVIGVDFTLAHFLYTVKDAYPECNDEDITCFVVDNSGFVVMHEDFLEYPTTDDKDKLQNIHIVQKEPQVAHDMIQKNYMESEECVDYEIRRDQMVWRISFSSTSVTGAGYEVYKVPDTDIFVIKKTATTSDNHCQCSSSTGASECMNALKCQCPCYSRPDLYFYCSATIVSHGDTTAACTPRVVEPELGSISESETAAAESLEQCFEFDCEGKTERECSEFAGCQWCGEGSCIDQQKSCEGDDSSGFPAGAIAGVVVALVVALLVVAVVVYCVVFHGRSKSPATGGRDHGHTNTAMTYAPSDHTTQPSAPAYPASQPYTTSTAAPVAEHVAPPSYGEVVRSDSVF